MIVLKHLAREFDVDPYKLRMFLRANEVATTKGRYQWEENDPALKKLRSLLSRRFAGSRTTTTGSQASTTPARLKKEPTV